MILLRVATPVTFCNDKRTKEFIYLLDTGDILAALKKQNRLPN